MTLSEGGSTGIWPHIHPSGGAHKDTGNLAKDGKVEEDDDEEVWPPYEKPPEDEEDEEKEGEEDENDDGGTSWWKQGKDHEWYDDGKGHASWSTSGEKEA